MAMTEEEYYQEISALGPDEAWQICEREGVAVPDGTLEAMQEALLAHFVGGGGGAGDMSPGSSGQPEPMMEQPPLDSEHEEEIWRVARGEFDRIDYDGLGTIDRYDTYTLAELLGHRLNDAELDDLMAQLDSGGEGRIAFDPFFGWLLDRNRAAHQAHYRQADAVPMPSAAAVLPPMSCPPQLHELEGLMANLSSPEALMDVLELSFQLLGEPQISVIGSGLGAARQLQKLDIRNNGFGNDGARTLAAALPGSSIIELVRPYRNTLPHQCGQLHLCACTVLTHHRNQLARCSLHRTCASTVLARTEPWQSLRRLRMTQMARFSCWICAAIVPESTAAKPSQRRCVATARSRTLTWV